MKVFKRLTGLSLFLIIALFPYYAEATRGIAIRPISPAGKEVKGDQWLFVIGIDTYIHWPRLKTAVSDAKSVRDVLLSRYHFDRDHLIELYDEQATRRNILGRLRSLAKKVRKDDSLVIFYAGHGHLDSITKAGSWIPAGSGIEDTSGWITNHDIKNYLRVDAIKAKHILLVSDSCFSGDFFRGHRGKLPEVTDTVIKKAYKLTSRQAITSGGLEPVSDEGFGKNSVFSHFLVKTLKENQKPFLVPSSFFPDIKAGVAENAEQFPRFGSLKDTGGQQGGEIILFLKQDTRLKDLSQEAAKGQKELERLRDLEKADRKTKKREAAAIAEREQELAKLDDQITEMRKRLGTSAARTDDGLDTMLAMVEKKETQQRRIDDLKKEQREKKIAAMEKDIEKYKKIISSKFGRDMKEAAWKSLMAKYPDAGDIEELKLRAKEIVQKLDRVTPQVMIEARIVEATDSFSREIGSQWGRGPLDNNQLGKLGGDFSYSMSAANAPTSTLGSIGVNFTRLAGIPFSLVNAKIMASEFQGQVKIVSAPKILTLDNKTATIKQGLSYPFNKLDADGNTTTEFKDIALELEVTPHVTPDNRISMEINIKNNEIGAVINNQISFTTKEATTELLINDGETIVIGGIRKTRKDTGESGVPGLSKIPILGWLFKTESKTSSLEELLIFITPKIVQLEQRDTGD